MTGSGNKALGRLHGAFLFATHLYLPHKKKANQRFSEVARMVNTCYNTREKRVRQFGVGNIVW